MLQLRSILLTLWRTPVMLAWLLSLDVTADWASVPQGDDWIVAPVGLSHSVELAPGDSHGVWLVVTCAVKNVDAASALLQVRVEPNDVILSCESGETKPLVEAAEHSNLSYPSVDGSHGGRCTTPRPLTRAYDVYSLKALMLEVAPWRRQRFRCAVVHPRRRAPDVAAAGVFDAVTEFEVYVSPTELSLTSMFTPVIYPPVVTADAERRSYSCLVYSQPRLDEISFAVKPDEGVRDTYQFVGEPRCIHDDEDTIERCAVIARLVSDGLRGATPVGLMVGAIVTCNARIRSTASSGRLIVSDPDNFTFPSVEAIVRFSNSGEPEAQWSGHEMACSVDYVAGVGARFMLQHTSSESGDGEKVIDLSVRQQQYSYRIMAAEPISSPFSTPPAMQCLLLDHRGRERHVETAPVHTTGYPTATVSAVTPVPLRSGLNVLVRCVLAPGLPFRIHFQVAGRSSGCAWSLPIRPSTRRMHGGSSSSNGTSPSHTEANVTLIADADDVQYVRCTGVRNRDWRPTEMAKSVALQIPYADSYLRQRSVHCHEPRKNTIAFFSIGRQLAGLSRWTLLLLALKSITVAASITTTRAIRHMK